MFNPLIESILEVYQTRRSKSDPLLDYIPQSKLDQLLNPNEDLVSFYSNEEYLLNQFRPSMLLPDGWYLTTHQYQSYGNESGGSLE